MKVLKYLRAFIYRILARTMGYHVSLLRGYYDS